MIKKHKVEVYESRLYCNVCGEEMYEIGNSEGHTWNCSGNHRIQTYEKYPIISYEKSALVYIDDSPFSVT